MKEIHSFAFTFTQDVQATNPRHVRGPYIFSNQKVGKIKQKKKQNYDPIQCLYQEKVGKKVQKTFQKPDPIQRILTFSKGPEIHANLFLGVVKLFKYGKRFRFAPSFNNFNKRLFEQKLMWLDQML